MNFATFELDEKSAAFRQEVLDFLDGKVAKWWIPESAVFVSELPHTATGKISKKDVRVTFEDFKYEE